jgi:hypothetical protein
MVTGDENRIIMQFETDGSLSAQDALRETLVLLRREYATLNEKL